MAQVEPLGRGVEIRENVELPLWFVEKTLDALGKQRQVVRQARRVGFKRARSGAS